jgi:hypothetical protein
MGVHMLNPSLLDEAINAEPERNPERLEPARRVLS